MVVCNLQIPEERLLHNGHAVDVVEAENRPFSKTKGSRLTAAEEREKELLETEAFDKLNISDDEHEDDQSSGNVTFRVSEGRTGPVPIINGKDQQDFPRWDARWPIDVWVSCGEPFMPLEGLCHVHSMDTSIKARARGWQKYRIPLLFPIATAKRCSLAISPVFADRDKR